MNAPLLMVPTVWAEVLVTNAFTAGGKTFKPGEVVKMPYGVALQGIVTGTFTVMKDADAKHAEAIEAFQEYGPDSWFPAATQTLCKFWQKIQQQRAAINAASSDTTH